jgi:hypothetical protein
MLGMLTLGAGAYGNQPDPYAILDKHVAAVGGWAALDAVKNSHSKATLVIEGAGLEGTVESWSQLPDKSRQEVDLKVIKQVSGDNGQFAWRIDQNGKLMPARDSATLKERQLSVLMAKREHMKRGSREFTVTVDRTDTANGATCYVLKTTNTINSFVFYDFIDTTNYLPIKTVVIKPDGETQTVNSDFRKVNGVLTPFEMHQLELPTGQRSTIKLLSLETNVAIDPTTFEPPSVQRKDYRFPAGKSVVEVPFKFIEQHIYLPLTINGKTRLWILDSGAEWTVVESNFARELGLELKGEMIGQGATNTVGVSFATLPPFELNGLAFDSQKVAAIGINDLFRKMMGFEIGGILGFDFLSRLVTRIDYAHELLAFYEPASFEYTGNGTVLNSPVTKGNMFNLQIAVDSQYQGSWDLDLGATGLDFFYSFAEERGLLGRAGVSRMSFGAGGGQLTTMARFKRVDFAGFTVPNLTVGIPTAKGTGSFSKGEMVGNAGNDLFRHFVLYLDYSREKVIVEKGADFAKVFPIDHSGLQVMYDDSGRAAVLVASAGTPSAQAGIKEGDLVTAIDGKSISEIGGLVKFREILKGEAGTAHKLDIDREGKPLIVTLTLKDLFD